jgi:CheY-like chemotaxis protein
VSVQPAPGAEAFQQQRFAIVCDDAPEHQGVIKAALEQVGFTMYAAKNAEDATERLRREPPELVILDEQFQGASALDNEVLAAIRALQMSIRRYVYVILLGREFKTFDNMMAFARSVNAVVNLNDLPHLPAIIKRGMADHAEFYRVYTDVLREAGKR